MLLRQTSIFENMTNRQQRKAGPFLYSPIFPTEQAYCIVQYNVIVKRNISFLTVCSTILNHLYCSFALLTLPCVQFCDSLLEGVRRILSTFCLEMNVVLHVHFTAFNLRVCMIQLKLLHLYTVCSFSCKYFKVQYEQNIYLSGLLRPTFRTLQKKHQRKILGSRTDETGYTRLIFSFHIEI